MTWLIIGAVLFFIGFEIISNAPQADWLAYTGAICLLVGLIIGSVAYLDGGPETREAFGKMLNEYFRSL